MEGQEQEIIQHFFHQHPLRRISNVAEDVSRIKWCYGCGRYFSGGEAGYGCSITCGESWCLHEECAEMAREIRHSVHPSHPLTQKTLNGGIDHNTKCVVCEGRLYEYGLMIYSCSRGCDFWIHLGCAGGLLVAADEQVMKHPSHPQHELKFLKGKRRLSSFKCDACGTIEKGNSYICSTSCDYWIHESCASLPTTARFHHHPDHSLSLAFQLPYEYIMYQYTCDICSGSLHFTHWVYHCKLCRYVVHTKCATNTTSYS